MNFRKSRHQEACFRGGLILLLLGLTVHPAMAGSVSPDQSGPKVSEEDLPAGPRSFRDSGVWDTGVTPTKEATTGVLAVPVVGPSISPLVLLTRISMESSELNGTWQSRWAVPSAAIVVSALGFDADRAMALAGTAVEPGYMIELDLSESGRPVAAAVRTGIRSAAEDGLTGPGLRNEPTSSWRSIRNTLVAAAAVCFMIWFGLRATKRRSSGRGASRKKKRSGKSRLLDSIADLQAGGVMASGGSSKSSRGRSGSSRGRSGSSRGRSGSSRGGSSRGRSGRR